KFILFTLQLVCFLLWVGGKKGSTYFYLLSDSCFFLGRIGVWLVCGNQLTWLVFAIGLFTQFCCRWVRGRELTSNCSFAGYSCFSTRKEGGGGLQLLSFVF
ncbi:unnamed protein product, partial [Pylaiella littoralis]